MFGKIVELRGKSVGGFEVTNEFECLIDNFYSLPFGNIFFSDISASKNHILGEFYTNSLKDGFTNVTIFNGNLATEDKEEYLLVIIPYAFQIATNTQRIAGRYHYEGIFKMFPGDTITVRKSTYGSEEIYIAVQADNEMFLIKKTR